MLHGADGYIMNGLVCKVQKRYSASYQSSGFNLI